MQDFHSFGDGDGQIFIDGDRHMRPINSSYQNHVIKCPRCESLNTKFCYYNNYNLSQPRHYCKSCRRYWTKGGVLRNVPVGGGCRKAKRSKPKPSVDTASAEVASVDIYSNSNCSSESSILTATTAPIAVVSAVVTDSSHFTAASFSLPESRFFVTPQTAAISESNYSTVVNFNNNNSSENSSYRLNTSNNNHHQQQQLHEDQQLRQLQKMARDVNNEHEVNLEEITTGLTQQADWQIKGTGGGGDNEESLFIHQFTAGAVDQSYWSQNQWSDHDHSLY